MPAARLAGPVLAVLDPQGRGRPSVAMRMRGLAGTQAGGFVLVEQPPVDMVESVDLNRAYVGKRSFSSSGSSRSLTVRRSATAQGSRLSRASKAATRRLRSSAVRWQWW